MTDFLIRPATRDDLDGIRRIFNAAIRKTTAVFIEQEVDRDWVEAWFAAHDDRHPILVADGESAVAGWVSISAFSSRCCYRYTAEVSVYIDERYWRRGLGRRLVEAAERAAASAGLHTLLAVIEAENRPSLSLFRGLGYEQVGLLREVGYKFDAWRSVAYYQKFLQPPAAASAVDAAQ
ncbi:MAG: GNAT family N-acetyltransferase [Candidatus Sumerlaeota bacterium]|nr:GNAT family N-acetyltransferase [Candidatus Sumerlaeota bacterium]